MSATFSKLGPLSLGESVSGFGPHIEELHAFFETRGIAYGSAEDLKPFVDRLDSDASFRDEMASMVRTIIYRERDGLSWAELMEVVAAAVGGPAVDETDAPEVREAVRRLMVFMESVFRTRRNPGVASVGGTEPLAASEPEQQQQPEPEIAAAPVAQEAMTAEAAESALEEHPKVDMFYRAQIVAEEEATEMLARGPTVEKPRVEDPERPDAEDDAVETETVLHTDLNWRVPFENFEGRETAERGSPAWLWVAGFCALLLAFCAGLFVHQRLIVPLRDPNTPYEKLPPETAEGTNGAASTPAMASAAKPTGMQRAAANPAITGTPVLKPNAVAVPSGDAYLRPKYMAPATIGASAASMAGRLVYAPPPAYPMMAEMTRIQGKVTVEAVVGKDGRVVRAQAVSGHHLLRGAAVREVYGRRYRPYTVNERPVNVATIVTVDFRLRR